MRKTGVLLAILPLVFALSSCAVRTPAASTSTIKSDGVVLSLFAKPRTLASGEIMLTLSVRNVSGQDKTFQLPSSKEFDFVAFVNKTDEVWKYSTGRLYAQVITTKSIPKGASYVYRAGFRPHAAGEYTVQGIFEGLPDARPSLSVISTP